MQALHDAIREESKPGLWSQGVKLARGGAVALESKTASELVLRVKSPARPVPYTVVVYPQDLAWECNCDGRVDPCEHVCAAAIALQTQDVTTAEQRWSHVIYRFSRVPGGLALSRTLENEEVVSLAALMAKPELKAKLQVEQHDLAVDRLLARPRRGAVPQDLMLSLLTALTGARRVLLDGAPVVVSAEPLVPRATIEDHGDQVSVTLALEPHEWLGGGAVLRGDTLQPLGESPEASVKTYHAKQLAELAATVLPDLARRYPVEVKSTRLPKIDRTLEPRVQLELNQVEQGLSVLPTLVYGAPPHVRIDAGRLTWLHGAVPLRDENAEARLVHELREKLDLVPGRRTTIGTDELARWGDKLKGWRGDLTGDAARALGAKAKLSPHFELGQSPTGAQRFGLEFQVEGSDQRVGGDAVLKAWSEGLGLVPLTGGGWAPLPQAWLERHGQKVLDLLEARQPDGTLANHALPQLAELSQALDLPPPPALEGLRPLVQGFESLPPPKLPADLAATLRPYQLQGVGWLQFLRDAGLGAVLADDMGLGKTLQTICVLQKGTLVVCPTSVLPNWLAELKRFRPGLKVCAYHGPGRALDASADVTVTTYALLRLDANELQAKSWDTLVLDEAQAIKNPDSQVARAAYAMQARFKVALSGTPIENRLEELWSVLHFTNRGLLGGRRVFDERWAQPVADGRPGAAASLRQRIKPFVLRRLKREVAPELPPRTESVMHIELDERERDVYQTVLAATRAEVVGLLEKGGSVLKALEALLRLRQAACHPALLPGQQARSSSKVKALTESLTTAAADGHKALVFSQWTSLLDLIEPELKDAGIAFERLDGSTADRGAVTARFESPEGPPVMLISLKAGGTGLNLTSADHVFLVDPWWNPAVEAQAADRAHRIGQTRPVTVYRLVAPETVEEKILQLQEQKRALFEAALGDGGAAGSLTRDDLLQLFA
ncbi:MAG: DEAD/DEAH box helicase [Archangiaceae bacterium]|nr:DEAD/DEAH box helicase [Archangiaceae bacterium]